MSTENQDAAGNAACPLCDEYEGQPSSVEAHISRMTDAVHQGEVGRAHRDDIQRQAGEATEDVVDEDDEDRQEDADAPGVAQWDVLADSSDEDGDEGEEDASGSEGEDGADDADDEDDADVPGGVPMPSAEALVVGAVVLAAVLYWRSRSSSSASTSAPSQQPEDEEGRSRQTMGGLSG